VRHLRIFRPHPGHHEYRQSRELILQKFCGATSSFDKDCAARIDPAAFAA